jgi:DNA-binding NtrC family response regulator
MKTSTVEEVLVSRAETPLKVLILEDSADDVELLLFELKQSGLNIKHTVAGDAEEFRRALREETFDAVLSDYRLPAWTGLDALKELRTAEKELPFLLVTGTLGEDAAVECMKQGVSDYILKEQISRLPLALKRAIRESTLRRENG